MPLTVSMLSSPVPMATMQPEGLIPIGIGSKAKLWSSPMSTGIVRPGIRCPKGCARGFARPVFYKVSGKEMLLVSAIKPLLDGETFLGVVGVDHDLSQLQKLVAQIQVLGQGYAQLIANDGTYVAHADDAWIGKKIQQQQAYSSEALQKISRAIKNGQRFSQTISFAPNESDEYQIFMPIHIGSAKQPWSLMVSIPAAWLDKSAQQIFSYSFWLRLWC